MESTKKFGKIRKGWEITKSSWHVLRLDKELLVMPILSIVVTLLILIPLALIAFSGLSLAAENITYSMSGWANGLLAFGLYFVITTIGNFFGAAVIYGATDRFRGNDPSLKSSLNGAFRKFQPLLLYSLMMTTVGFVLQMLAERVPFAGRIAVWLFGAAWNVANFFALPVIVLSDQQISPIDATKQSIATIKKVWGESIVADLGVSLIGLIGTLLYVFVVGAIGAGLRASAFTSPYIFVAYIALTFIGLIAMVLVFSVMSSIVKAALYHYATTGEAPDQFNRELLRTTFTPKKARKIFA